MEQETTTLPSWVEEMQKWQQEDTGKRAVFCVATDSKDVCSALMGSNLHIMAALLGSMFKDSKFEELCKTTLEIKNNPIATLAFATALKESKTTHEDNGDKSDDSTLKDLLKTILTKLTNKL